MGVFEVRAAWDPPFNHHFYLGKVSKPYPPPLLGYFATDESLPDFTSRMVTAIKTEFHPDIRVSNTRGLDGLAVISISGKHIPPESIEYWFMEKLM